MKTNHWLIKQVDDACILPAICLQVPNELLTDECCKVCKVCNLQISSLAKFFVSIGLPIIISVVMKMIIMINIIIMFVYRCQMSC